METDRRGILASVLAFLLSIIWPTEEQIETISVPKGSRVIQYGDIILVDTTAGRVFVNGQEYERRKISISKQLTEDFHVKYQISAEVII